jgi:mono/diheme cytochrome c family protein
LASGLQIYATNCVACHGANGEGTTLAPALNTDELRARLTADDIARIVTQGVPGTLMAGWARAL